MRPSVIAFFCVLICYKAVATFYPGTCSTTIDQSDADFTFAQLSFAKVKSGFDWLIAVQLGINLHRSYNTYLKYLYDYQQ